MIFRAIDKIILSIKLPSEIKRATRSINDRHHYKANEFRYIAYYLTFALFKDNLKLEFFNNMLKYIIFLRLLSQDFVTKSHIKDAELLIKSFITEYESLYGKDFMSYNTHAHLHLPAQVAKFGPLTKLSCFPFENLFKISRTLYHGTCNFDGQIARNLELIKMNKTNLNKLKTTTKNPQIKLFVNEYLLKNIKSNENQILGNMTLPIVQLKEMDRKLLIESNFSPSQSILIGQRAIINNRGKFHNKN